MAQQQSPGLIRLFPRRKAQDMQSTGPEQGSSSTSARNRRAPMVLSLDSIAPLFDLPQGQAAQRLGVSITSLKVVCRKLGVGRWPYMRGDIKARITAASTAGKKMTKTQQEQEMREEASNNYHHNGCTLSGRFGPLSSPGSEQVSLSSRAPSSSGWASRTQAGTVIPIMAGRDNVGRRDLSCSRVPPTSEPIFASTTRCEPALSRQAAPSRDGVAHSALRACMFLTEGPVKKLCAGGGEGEDEGHVLADTTSRGLWGCDFGNRTCFDVELKAAPCLLEPPATRSFSTEDTPASHRQSSIPSAAQGSLSTDSRPALPGVYGVHVQPAQRLPDEPAEPHAGLLRAHMPIMTSPMSSPDDLSWLLCNSDPLAGDILAMADQHLRHTARDGSSCLDHQWRSRGTSCDEARSFAHTQHGCRSTN